MQQLTRAGLDHAEALLPGHGLAQVGGYVTPAGYGATLDVEARIGKAVSAYADGWVGDQSRGAMGGLRVRW